ncbi:MAG: hypothetical protein ACRC5T_00710, partial [Cetobacterium sp.]
MNTDNTFIVDSIKSQITLRDLGQVAYLDTETDNLDYKNKKIILSFSNPEKNRIFKSKLKGKGIDFTSKFNYSIDVEKEGFLVSVPILESDSIHSHSLFVTQARNTEYLTLKGEYLEDKIYSTLPKNIIV